MRQLPANNSGVALVMALIISAIALGVMAGMIHMITGGTQMSGIQKRYKTALEASVGGMDVTIETITQRDNPQITGVSVPAENVGGVDCLTEKLTKDTVDWDPACNDSIIIDHGNSATYDITLSLGDAPLQYDTFAKIVDTAEGNTGGDEGLLNCGVVCSNPGLITVVAIPYIYSIGVDSVNSSNEAERARLAVMYQY
jgi:ABC-type lipoprotein release transport system permease subunit